MSFLTRILLVTVLVGSCVPQNIDDIILLTLESTAARQEKLLQKFEEQETKLDSQQTMMQELKSNMDTHQTMLQEVTRRLTVVEANTNSTQEELVSKFSREEQYYLTMTAHCNEIKISNCKELLDRGVIQSGVYTITPEGFPDGVKVYCDQETDGGGWNVILRRQKQTHQVNFKKTFEEYASGFGDPNGELWIGNRVLHSMTGKEPFTLRVDAKNLEGESRTGIWQTFSVGSEDTQFTLSIADYSSSSTLGDGIWKPSLSRRSANNMKFSTTDRDNDEASGGSCSADWGQGGWWYNSCYGVNPTAPFGDSNRDFNKANWVYWESSSSESFIAISEIHFMIRA